MQAQHNLCRNNSIVLYCMVCVLLESFIKFVMCMYMLVLIRELQMAVCVLLLLCSLLHSTIHYAPLPQKCQQKLNHIMPLQSLLIKPVQRILKYHLLLAVCSLYSNIFMLPYYMCIVVSGIHVHIHVTSQIIGFISILQISSVYQYT